jgi:hypothetical protein
MCVCVYVCVYMCVCMCVCVCVCVIPSHWTMCLAFSPPSEPHFGQSVPPGSGISPTRWICICIWYMGVGLIGISGFNRYKWV